MVIHFSWVLLPVEGFELEASLLQEESFASVITEVLKRHISTKLRLCPGIFCRERIERGLVFSL